MIPPTGLVIDIECDSKKPHWFLENVESGRLTAAYNDCDMNQLRLETDQSSDCVQGFASFFAYVVPDCTEGM